MTSIVVEPMGSAAEVVAPTLIKLLADPREEMRVWAADSLGKLGPEAKQGVPALTGLLSDMCPSVRQTAATALGQLGHTAMAATPPLTALLRDQTMAVRNAATAALIQIAHEAREIEQKANSQDAAQKAKLQELAKKVVAQVVPEAVALLDDPCWEIRRNAADVLGGIGPSAQEAIPALTNRLADQDPMVRISAAAALTSVAKPDACLPSVEKLLHDPHAGVRTAAADLLGRVGSAENQTIPAAIEALGDSEYRVRIAAAAPWAKSWPTNGLWSKGLRPTKRSSLSERRTLTRMLTRLSRRFPRCWATPSPTFAWRPCPQWSKSRESDSRSRVGQGRASHGGPSQTDQP